jgi:hypothetical protein
MPETRVDLKHLLEDIRDSYPCRAEEAILTELMANALDSGCSRVDIRVEPAQKRLTFVDNGEGMNREAFVQYHDIASTGKVRGKGIGFAGVGAKLALLVCREVLTETRCAGTALGSRWSLESSFKAPWEPAGGLGIVTDEKGTGVRLHFRDGEAPALLSAEAVRDIIRRHFCPLLDVEFTKILRYIYPKGVSIEVNGERVSLPEMEKEAAQYFLVFRGRRKKVLGIGLIVKTKAELEEGHYGLAISTFGKVIKRGWEWLGVTPRNPARLAGVVEVPELVDCLTTNKCEFMRDPNSLQKYYNYRKTLQEAVAKVLEDLGEARAQEPKADKAIERLQKEIDRIVGEILPDFPELAPLFGRKKSGAEVPALLRDPDGKTAAASADGTDVGTGDEGGEGEGGGVEGAIEGPLDGTHLEVGAPGSEQAREHTSRRKRPGLMIRVDDETGGGTLAWLQGSTLFINGLHPAYKRAQSSGGTGLYFAFAVASTLSAHLQEGRAPLEFLERFMAAWGGMT